MQLENQAGLPLTGRDARRVRPHQSAYSIGKRVNEGRTRRALLSQRFLQTISYLLKYQQLIKKKVYGGF
jgi:DNA topoisomerase IB